MSESPPAESEGSDFTPYIETVYFDEWAPLGGPVALSLSPRRTVLVGRNGGGKSLLLEGLREVARHAGFVRIYRQPKLNLFRVDVRHGSSLLHYSYKYKPAARGLRENRGSTALVVKDWQEQCWAQDPKQPLWSVDEGVLFLNSNEKINLGSAGNSLPAIDKEKSSTSIANASHNLINSLLLGLKSVEALMPIRDGGRGPILLKEDPSDAFITRVDFTAHTLASDLWELFESDEEEFEELSAVGQRIGIWQKLAIEKYVKERGSSADVLAEVTVDGVNLGMTSDGTLRLLKILLALVASPYRQGTLLIDEPELGIHPGLLARLLAEFEAYGAGRQLVIATHSPQVVSWAKPEELRLVERVEGRTVVRSLSEEQAARVHSYLQDQGNLGEFVYGGGVDD